MFFCMVREKEQNTCRGSMKLRQYRRERVQNDRAVVSDTLTKQAERLVLGVVERQAGKFFYCASQPVM